jgi:hypothetical protein
MIVLAFEIVAHMGGHIGTAGRGSVRGWNFDGHPLDRKSERL